MQILAQAGWDILDKRGQKTWPSDEPEVEIDFIVIRGLAYEVVESRVIDEQTASDHRPVVAVISF
jgi:endonuclease/exonuclease/phosphatase family metal-dependent hydrolase